MNDEGCMNFGQIQYVHYGVAIAYSCLRLIALFIFGYWGIGYLAQKMKRALGHAHLDELRLALIGGLFTYIVRFVVLVAFLYECGVNVSALLAVLGVFGVAVGYAAKTGVGNVISGFFLMMEKPFVLGDTLLIEGQEGIVTGVNLFAVTVKMADRTVRLPHDYLLKHNIVKMKK